MKTTSVRILLEYRLTNLNIYNYEKTIIYLTTPCAGGMW